MTRIRIFQIHLTKACLTFLLISLSSVKLFAQNTDTSLVRDVGVNVSWRSLATSYKSIESSADVVRNLQFGVETRAWRFWIQTGVVVGWNRNLPFRDSYNLDVYVSMTHEWSIFKKRCMVGVGPISSYYHFFNRYGEWNAVDNTWSTQTFDGIGLGVALEITVPIWQGISLETSSDIGAMVTIGRGRVTQVAPRIVRLLSIGINYRIKAYPKRP